MVTIPLPDVSASSNRLGDQINDAPAAAISAPFADLPTFEEAVSWLDARNPNKSWRGRFFGVATNEQIRILNEKGYGPY